MGQLLVVGNWKMNGSEATVAALLGEMALGLQTSGVDVAICPTYVHIEQAVKAVASSPIAVGAQDCSHMAPVLTPVKLRRYVGSIWGVVGDSGSFRAPSVPR